MNIAWIKKSLKDWIAEDEAKLAEAKAVESDRIAGFMFGRSSANKLVLKMLEDWTETHKEVLK